jgi:NADH-quinone oxidoreductase subunit A
MLISLLPVLMLIAAASALVVALLVLANLFNPRRPGRVKCMPYESGMDPIHDTHRRFGVDFHLLAIAFLVFDVELLFLYPWAVALRAPAALPAATATATSVASAPATAPAPAPPPTAPANPTATAAWPPRPIFVGGLVFLVLLALGFLYDWRKGIFQWR